MNSKDNKVNLSQAPTRPHYPIDKKTAAEIGTHPTMAATPPPGNPSAPSGIQALRVEKTFLEGATIDERVEVAEQTLGFAQGPERYNTRRLLGEGGMGEVHACRDRTIGREVAMKVVRSSALALSPDIQARFVREARIQGQLEHPAIVPVYDLGINQDGAAYFTMKRIRGRSLDEVLIGLQKKDSATVKQYSRRKLLTAFVSVCYAIDFAHNRGVLHRDLKPGNVMLGDFGEVYVLDWGVAKVLGTADLEMQNPSEAVELSQTAMGALVGTPGYMSPEQARGEVHTLDARADVYSLGAILFEILTLEPMHLGNNIAEVFESTLSGTKIVPSLRSPNENIPPELDQIFAKATESEMQNRYQSARELAESIEHFLDGDRDAERRRELAGQHALAAESALNTPFKDADSEASTRSRAMREVITALGLDPQHRGALKTLVRLLTEFPKNIPPGALKADAEARLETLKKAAFLGSRAHFIYAIPAAFVFWMSIRNWFMFGFAAVSILLTAALLLIHYLRGPKTTDVPYFILGASCLAVASGSVILGPYISTPLMAIGGVISYLSVASVRSRPRIIVGFSLSMVLPWILQLLHVLPASYLFSNGTMVVVPNMTELPEVPTNVFLLVTHVTMMLAIAYFFLSVINTADDAQLKLRVQSWQLRQAIPEDFSEDLHSLPPNAAVSR